MLVPLVPGLLVFASTAPLTLALAFATGLAALVAFEGVAFAGVVFAEVFAGVAAAFAGVLALRLCAAGDGLSASVALAARPRALLLGGSGSGDASASS